VFNGTIIDSVDLESGRYEAGNYYESINMTEDEELHGNGTFIGVCEFTSEGDDGLYVGGDFVVEESYAADLGRTMEPLTSPLGFNWRINTALIFGFVAKEVVVGTLGVFYGGGEDDDGVGDSIKDSGDFTPLTAFCLMVFVLLYLPCVATIPVMYRETGSLKWTSFSVVYGLTLAWLLVFIIYRVGLWMGY